MVQSRRSGCRSGTIANKHCISTITVTEERQGIMMEGVSVLRLSEPRRAMCGGMLACQWSD
eukprot:3746193-Rhodomonas_salina.1